MKTQNNKPHFFLMAAIVAVFAAFTVSCNKDDDPSLSDLREDKLQYLEDSLRISDSLKRINAAGVVNYAITVVNGSTSSLFSDDNGPGREKESQSALDGAIVTISQYGKTLTDTTDASGMVVFTGFFRTSVNVTIRKEGFTTVAYSSVVNLNNTTSNNTISFIGNIIPVFELTGANTATIAGRATIETNLTNNTRESVPDGTKITASIDANSNPFRSKFLTYDLVNIYYPSCGCEILYAGEIIQAAYSTGVIGSVTGGNYTLTVPAAIDGLPLNLEYSDIAADQTLYENSGVIVGDRTETYRTLFLPNGGVGLSTVPSGAGVQVGFAYNTTNAVAAAVISATTGSINSIEVVNGGAGYAGVPVVRITGDGTGAAATAVVTNGRVTSINVTSGGTGYTTATIDLLDGNAAAAGTVTNLAQDGTVISIVVTNSGSGYTTAPAVTIAAPTGTTSPVTATATANVSNGRVTSISITNAGFSYLINPVVTIAAPPAGGVQATADAFFSGRSISDVQITNAGADYSFAPAVVFAAPTIAGGVRATGTATVSPVTGQVTGITITNAGMGYTAVPAVTLVPFTTAATTDVIFSGGSVVGINVSNSGSGYVGVPEVTLIGGGGQGATATAVVTDGKIVAINVTNAGNGYTGVPTVNINEGESASGYATVVNGAITGVTVADGGRFFNAAPRVTFTSNEGNGAAATATVANGVVTAVTMTSGGSNYLPGNIPGSAQGFSSTKGNNHQTRPGLTYINDVHYGTGTRQPK
jgi:hypothetical protein